jgi:deazaflavin-dependent oxidoreductase (nitroreductase family)
MNEYVYLTTMGRRTGNPHTIEIWYAVHNGCIYLMAGGRDRSDWVRNLIKHPAVQLRAGEITRAATARIVTEPEEDALARRLLAAKYQGWREGTRMSEWARTALPVAIDFPNGDCPVAE